ncbi:tetratricopeptide repeat protein [Psychroflexus sp. YR1-1]|uniref:Tetratricopeptide repeat protein n=1 Tax=Psychroflexus aurantiacus TaxID=2709310 RepID=A0A6B3R4K3_9FLAO|nr:tetratricopeptide repeat protein [Psychroflexus aurantiacus]NEV92811.1 tetratricopeptide repeat protein [Psychroflexus aurantiacus]
MKFYTYLLVFLFTSLGFSQAEETFEKANSAYADDQFEEAIQLYNSILKEGLVSSEVYFNLGNAYFKQNKLANAIYHYEKALQYDPADPEIKENLEIARTQTVDKVAEGPESQFSAFMYTVTHTLKLNTWAWVSLVFSILFGVWMVFYFRSANAKGKRKNFSLALIFLAFALGSLLLGRFQSQLQNERSYAIIFENQLPVYGEPNPRSDVNFELNAGTKVKLGSSFRDYTEIELSDGSKGWVKTTAFKEL